VSTVAQCDGSAAEVVYEEFAMSFNANEIALATAQFAGQHHDLTWWDPSDPSGQTQVRAELDDHFRHMYDLGVRLPATATFVAVDDGGLGGFNFNTPHNGFYGKGALDCGSGKLSYLVIDGWTKNIAGRAPVNTG
jgi:hypothetical protein